MGNRTELATEARELAKRAQAVKAAPFLARAEMASGLVDQMTEFLVELAERVDDLAPNLNQYLLKQEPPYDEGGQG